MSARGFKLTTKNQGNIQISESANLRILQLHSNTIVKHNKESNELYITDAGWVTRTTKVAINRYMSLIGADIKVHTVKGQEVITINGKSELFQGEKEVSL